jgi:1,4-dihydroxy-2-naphthoyl-CoA synthase
MSGAIKLQVGMGGLVAKITLNRPEKLNAFDREMLRELGDIVRGVSDSDKLRVVRAARRRIISGSWRRPSTTCWTRWRRPRRWW